MRNKRLVWLFLVWKISAQTVPTEPSGTFDLQLEKRAGPGARITAFVARESRLYFAVSGPGGFLEFQTTREGVVERSHSIGAEPVSGFDVDEAGNSYVLHGGSRLSEFGSEGEFKLTLNLQSPIVSFAVLGKRPIGVSADGSLHFLDGPGGGFTLSAYPSPWLLFAIEPGRLGVLGVQDATLHLFRYEDGEASDASTVWLGAIIAVRKPIAAAADREGRIYLVGERGGVQSHSVIECDQGGKPKFMFDYAGGGGFNPRMIGIMNQQVYLVDPGGRVAFYSLNRGAASVVEVDANPELLSDVGPFRAAVRKAGYTGRVVIQLDVGAGGVGADARVQSPAFLANVTGVTEAIGRWRFRSAVRGGHPAVVPMELNIDVF